MSKPSSGQRLTRAEQAAATRARILDVALRLFAARGFAGTSTRRIAKEAGVSEGLIFHHFPTKSDLLRGIARSRNTMAVAVVQLVGEAEALPATLVLPRIASRFVHMLGSQTTESHLFRMLISESHNNDELAALLDSVSGEVVAAITGYLRARVAAGELDAALPCEAAAQSLLGAFLWYMMTHRDPEAWGSAAAQYAEYVVAHWLRGALARPELG